MIDAKKYFLLLTSMLLILTAAGMLILGGNLFKWFLVIPGIFLFLGTVFFFYKKKLVKKDLSSNTFFTYYMIYMFTKLLIAIAVIAIYLIFVEENRFAFVISFFIFYMAFSIFERIVYLKVDKKNKMNKNISTDSSEEASK